MIPDLCTGVNLRSFFCCFRQNDIFFLTLFYIFFLCNISVRYLFAILIFLIGGIPLRRRIFCLFLSAILLLSVCASADTTISGSLTNKVKLAKSYPDNELTEGVNPFTGLPASDAVFTPIMIVLDNAEEAHPHWGVSQADILFQVPNAGQGATKLLALFADSYPAQVGGCRSGRGSMVSVAKAFGSAFAYAGCGNYSGANVDVTSMIKKWNIRGFNLLSTNYAERVSYNKPPHNLSCHVADIHEKLVSDNVTFTPRSFLFTDDPLDRGETANKVSIYHYGEKKGKGTGNPASASTFTYDAENDCYYRSNAVGTYIDRDTDAAVPFANVIVLRTAFAYQNGSVYLKKHLVGHGTAEIFQNGRYIQGAWTRDSLDSRLVFTDENGHELAFQRGKSFIIISNQFTNVIYN